MKSIMICLSCVVCYCRVIVMDIADIAHVILDNNQSINYIKKVTMMGNNSSDLNMSRPKLLNTKK
jgi:hypothetical protein